MEGTAGSLHGELAYLNRIDDLLNVDPAQTTFQPAVLLTPRRGAGFDRFCGPWGIRGAAWAPADLLTGAVTAAARIDHPSLRWLSLALTQKCQ